jgi:alginate export protein
VLSRRATNRWISQSIMKWLVAAALLGSFAPFCLGQQPTTTRAYQPNLADEDWSFLKDESKRADFWDPLKYISLGAEDRFLTLGGEVRFRPEGFRIRGVGDTPSIRDGYFLQRYLFGGDFHLSRRFRFYTELQSGIINGKLNSPRPTDQDSLDLHQAFFEWREKLSSGREFGLRVGRQELGIGSSRLISASPGLNVKRSFDGADFSFKANTWHLDAGVAKLVSLSKGVFDDAPGHEQTFWGIAVARKSPHFKQGQLGFYYLGLDRANSVYNQGTGRDQRHTVGVRWSGSGPRLDLNYDVIYQWGTFSNAPARAWAFSTETGYRIARLRWKPRFTIRADIASGDKDPANPRLQSFNPFFPGNSYAGAVGLLGPTNLIDFTPGVSMIPRAKFILLVEWPNYWRTSLQDGLYRTDLSLLVRPAAGQGSHVGSNPGIVPIWQATRHIMLQGAITRFFSGPFLEKTFVANGFVFYSFSFVYRF